MNKDDPKLLEAILLAQTTIRTSSKKMDRNAIAVLYSLSNSLYIDKTSLTTG